MHREPSLSLILLKTIHKLFNKSMKPDINLIENSIDPDQLACSQCFPYNMTLWAHHNLSNKEILICIYFLYTCLFFCLELMGAGRTSRTWYFHTPDILVNVYLAISFNICFGCSTEPSHWEGSFEYPQPMFWIRHKKMNFKWNKLHTLISGSDIVLTG